MGPAGFNRYIWLNPTLILMRFLGTVAMFALFLVSAAAAQNTFTVTLETKTAAHPYFGQGHPDGFVINAVQGPELTLQRGQTYTFQMSAVPSFHPFYISTSSVGGGQGVWSEGVTGNFASGNGVLTFTVPDTAPDELWYQCNNHGQMGWKIEVIGSSSAEGEADGFSVDLTSANPARDRIGLEVTLAEASSAVVEVIAADGRRVALLHDGPLTAHIGHRMELDGSALSSGVYLIRVLAGERSAERRITLAR